MTVSRGITGLAGHNGAGKTTLMETVVGILRPVSGRVLVAGRAPSQRRDRRAAMRDVGYVPQEPRLPSRATVEEALLYAGWLKNVARGELRAAAHEAARRVDLQDKLSATAGSLSGGMRRRLAVAQALVHEPAVLVLDEPTVGLDPAQRLALHRVLLELAEDRAILLSTHLADDLARLCTQVVVLRDGEVAWEGDLHTLPDAAENMHDAVDRLLLAQIGDVDA
jgi:ABC-2 type transport system ATP-binding protein